MTKRVVFEGFIKFFDRSLFRVYFEHSTDDVPDAPSVNISDAIVAYEEHIKCFSPNDVDVGRRYECEEIVNDIYKLKTKQPKEPVG